MRLGDMDGLRYAQTMHVIWFYYGFDPWGGLRSILLHQPIINQIILNKQPRVYGTSLDLPVPKTLMNLELTCWSVVKAKSLVARLRLRSNGMRLTLRSLYFTLRSRSANSCLPHPSSWCSIRASHGTLINRNVILAIPPPPVVEVKNATVPTGERFYDIPVSDFMVLNVVAPMTLS